MLEAELKKQVSLAKRNIETWPLSIRLNMRVSDPRGIPYRPDPALRGPGIWIVECAAGCESPWFPSEEAAMACQFGMEQDCADEHTVAEFVRAEPKRST